MIHHVSISARHPQHVAAVLAELMQGRSYPFAGAISGSFMAAGGDAYGTVIEVYPATDGEGAAAGSSLAPRLLLSVPVEHGTIMEVAAREGWRTTMHPRGVPGQPAFFNVIELWVENRLMLELAPEEMMDEYVEKLQLPVLDRALGQLQAA